MATIPRATIRNPLTLMAIFAGTAEVCATVALPRLASPIQDIFVWFVVGFPFSIVVPFFVLLWFRPRHLYGPGDFRKDPNWLSDRDSLPPVPSERKKKKFKERSTPLTSEVAQ